MITGVNGEQPSNLSSSNFVIGGSSTQIVFLVDLRPHLFLINNSIEYVPGWLKTTANTEEPFDHKSWFTKLLDEPNCPFVTFQLTTDGFVIFFISQ